MNHRLSGDLSKLGPIVPRWILHDVEVNHPRGEGILAVLNIADLIDDEQGVDKVAADPKTLVGSEWVSVGDQELVTARDEFRALLIAKNLEAVDPCPGFGGRGFVVWVGCVLQRAHRMKIGEGELLHGRRGHGRRDAEGRREGRRVLGGSDGGPSNHLIWSAARTCTFGSG